MCARKARRFFTDIFYSRVCFFPIEFLHRENDEKRGGGRKTDDANASETGTTTTDTMQKGVTIRATKKGACPISLEKRKHWSVTVVNNVYGKDEDVERLCSVLGKNLGATARMVNEKGGSKSIEIQGHHEKRVEVLLNKENVLVGVRKEKTDRDTTTVETEKKERAKPRHANKKYWDTKTGLIKECIKGAHNNYAEEDPVKPEDVLRVKHLRETNREFARFCELMRKYPFWSHRYDKLAAMYFDKRNDKVGDEDEGERRKRRRCEIAFEEEEGEERDRDAEAQKYPKSLEELGMVATVSEFRISREERAKAAKQKMAKSSQQESREMSQLEEYEDIATKMLRMRGFAPASTMKKKPTTTTTRTTTTTKGQKLTMPPKKKKSVPTRIPSGTGEGFGRKAWSQKQFDKDYLMMSTTTEDGEDEDEEEDFQRAQQNVAARPLTGGRFLENAFPSLQQPRASSTVRPNATTEHRRLPHEEFQQTAMSEEDALKLALSLSADEHARERSKLDEDLEHELEVARAVSLSEARGEQEAQKQSSLSNDIAQTLRQLGFDRDVSEMLASDVLPAMPTHQDVIDLLGTLGIETEVASNFANFIVLNSNDDSSPSNDNIDDTETFLNLSLRELTGTDSNLELIEYLQKMEHREDAGTFLKESFGGNEETFRLGAHIWDAKRER